AEQQDPCRRRPGAAPDTSVSSDGGLSNRVYSGQPSPPCGFHLRTSCYGGHVGDVAQDAATRERIMLRAYIPIFLFILVGIAFAIVTLIVSRLVHAEKVNLVKLEPYECGIEPQTDARDRYSVRYYLVAMLFVIFDVETVFMFPWAVVLARLALFGLIEMIVFLAILVAGYAYAWKKGALEWA